MELRCLTELDWQQFRDLRLLALRNEPGLFSATLAVEAGKDQAWWQARVQSERHQVFGVFSGHELAGMIGVFTDWYDPSDATAVIGMLFVAPVHRGKGLSRRLFDAALEWVRARPHFLRATVGHRASNEASMRAILRQHFVERGRTSHLWPDGTTEDEVTYLLEL
nr:GNAT family N-acetyltransferase [uncultured Rhodopila sp.]